MKKIDSSKKRRIFLIFISILFIAISYFLNQIDVNIKKSINNNPKYLEDIIFLDSDKENKKAYINVIDKIGAITHYNYPKNNYYLVSDEKRVFVIYASLYEWEQIDINKTYKLEGVTHKPSNDVKLLAIDLYNTIATDKKMTLSDYDNYFGDVYLDVNQEEIKTLPLLKITSNMFLIIGIVLLVIIFL